MDTRYCLEIYGEEDHDTPGTVLYSNESFLAINTGDLIHPGAFQHWGGRERSDWMLEVTKIEHIIFESGKNNSKHKLCVYTRYVPNTLETRRGS
jgi:hypothetical protein